MCDVDVEDVNFDITVTQVKDKDKTVTPFSLNVKRISGKVSNYFMHYFSSKLLYYYF